MASARAIRIDCDHGRLDGFDLAVDTDHVSIHGHTPRGAIYGAYQVLEDMGCRWYYIGELGEVVPKSTHVSLAGGRSSQIASFPERSGTRLPTKAQGWLASREDSTVMKGDE